MPLESVGPASLPFSGRRVPGPGTRWGVWETVLHEGRGQLYLLAPPLPALVDPAGLPQPGTECGRGLAAAGHTLPHLLQGGGGDMEAGGDRLQAALDHARGNTVEIIK